jgi:hypothetical protein
MSTYTAHWKWHYNCEVEDNFLWEFEHCRVEVSSPLPPLPLEEENDQSSTCTFSKQKEEDENRKEVKSSIHARALARAKSPEAPQMSTSTFRKKRVRGSLNEIMGSSDDDAPSKSILDEENINATVQGAVSEALGRARRRFQERRNESTSKRIY